MSVLSDSVSKASMRSMNKTFEHDVPIYIINTHGRISSSRD